MIKPSFLKSNKLLNDERDKLAQMIYIRNSNNIQNKYNFRKTDAVHNFHQKLIILRNL